MSDLGRVLAGFGATEVLVKRLAPNDNGKNQIYLAGDVSALGKIPTGEVQLVAGTSQKAGAKRGPIFRSAVNMYWLGEDYSLVQAPHAKLILYPQYSEVRLSGFVRDCPAAPSHLFDIKRAGRNPGRVLLLAPLPDGRVITTAFSPESAEAKCLLEQDGEPYGVLHRFELGGDTGTSSETLLISRLRSIHLAGWLDPVYLQPDGSHRPCLGPNCGGVTLESHLGILSNGRAEPDFHGWEVKQHGVFSLARPRSTRITLMTPEPSGGAYVDAGPEYFIRTWGYEDRKGRADRINFGGVYRSGGDAHSLTGLRLVLQGYDSRKETFDGDGCIALLDRADEVAASWSFAKLMNHWRMKHAKAAFVPSQLQRSPTIRYRYGSNVMLAEGAKFKLLLRAFAEGAVYYDPGLKMEKAASEHPEIKRRSQFRVDSRKLASLYEKNRIVDVLEGT
ncbi:MvaI/BcnI family restriction endonuclease [Pseudoxanthomonas dokdonensis]|uniref:MvaI/BcnI family restriction endonuclease n=1 Tax=Pseudoxanthomonas dokdonensis TaxID=344882 RepID=UPI0014775724|nr:MvaI/BcnI family restriction endonuclease [Pseudoxanthomonas dokdonensis]